MRKSIRFIGFVLLLVGVSGAIDHLAVQPFFGFLNLVNREVIPALSSWTATSCSPTCSWPPSAG
jgi:hypothetical protein